MGGGGSDFKAKLFFPALPVGNEHQGAQKDI